jgi:hypothetical protein
MNDAAIQVLASMEQQLAEDSEALARLSKVVLWEGWIVQCEGVSLAFDTKLGVASDAKPCGPISNATRFTKRDAKAVAKLVKNGNETVGTAIHIRDAYVASIANLQTLIALIKDKSA